MGERTDLWLSGAGEIAGAIGSALPLGVYTQLGLPNLRRWAGIGLAVMLCFLVIANINVAINGGTYGGVAVPGWYLWLRPFLQPVIILWIVYAAEVIAPPRRWTVASSVGA